MRTLRLKVPMMHGPAVMRLQELGDRMGIDGGSNDGIFGPDTQGVVVRVQRLLGVKDDGICGPVTWAEILKFADMSDDLIPALNLGEIVDISDPRRKPRLYSHNRPLKQVTGVVLHQTGCEMPRKPAAWNRVNAHYGITQEGIAIKINPPEFMIWHAQGLSRRSLGIEIEGNFEGIKGDPSTLWKGGGGPHYLNNAMEYAAEAIFFDIFHLLLDNGLPFKYVNAHRQSYKNRVGDPGSEIWHKIGRDWLDHGDATDGGPDYFKGSGKPIPREWNSDYPNLF